MASVDELFGKYTKGDATADLRTARQDDRRPVAPEVSTSDISTVATDYKKDDGTIPGFLIVVISGGEVREADYLTELTKKRTFPHVRLIFASSEKLRGGLSPKMMQAKLNEVIDFDETEQSRRIYYSSVDRIFMVSDVDHFYEELREILGHNTDAKITWTVSNPCFEIWLYYAYFERPSATIRTLETEPSHKRSSRLKTLNNEVRRGGIDPRKAFEELRAANRNSRNNYHEDSNGIPTLYSTGMYMLGEYILEAIGEGAFDKWLAGKQARIEAFRSRMK